ncbi:MAG: hypothetical protein GQ570_07130 [Helicobacteraceae bacterium]|nr:hypothetical protein [Helicobacteraceae bacterium]
MKLAKLSLAAVLIMGANAFAIDNVKVDGTASLYYTTQDDTTNDLFDKSGAAAQTGVNAGVSANLVEGVSAGARVQALSTLGLENQLVDNVWAGGTQDQWWMSDLWMAATLGNTTAKVGRQAIDTPLAFTETWNIAYNTFEAAVLLNTDLPNTTLVGAYVGATNSSNNGTVTKNSSDGSSPFEKFGNTLAQQYLGTGTAVVGNGAYAAGIVNASIPDTTVQGWYYAINQLANAYWLQGDTKISIVTLGAQYSDIDPNGQLDALKNSTAYAFKAGVDLSGVALEAAYSSTDEDGTLRVQNTAGTESKLYTEAWWNFEKVSQPGTSSYKVTAAYDASFASLYALYVNADQKASNGDNDLTEITLTATKSFGALESTLAYISTEAKGTNNGDQYNTIQAYLTLNF